MATQALLEWKAKAPTAIKVNTSRIPPEGCSAHVFLHRIINPKKDKDAYKCVVLAQGAPPH